MVHTTRHTNRSGQMFPAKVGQPKCPTLLWPCEGHCHLFADFLLLVFIPELRKVLRKSAWAPCCTSKPSHCCMAFFLCKHGHSLGCFLSQTWRVNRVRGGKISMHFHPVTFWILATLSRVDQETKHAFLPCALRHLAGASFPSFPLATSFLPRPSACFHAVTWTSARLPPIRRARGAWNSFPCCGDVVLWRRLRLHLLACQFLKKREARSLAGSFFSSTQNFGVRARRAARARSIRRVFVPMDAPVERFRANRHRACRARSSRRHVVCPSVAHPPGKKTPFRRRPLRVRSCTVSPSVTNPTFRGFCSFRTRWQVRFDPVRPSFRSRGEPEQTRSQGRPVA